VFFAVNKRVSSLSPDSGSDGKPDSPRECVTLSWRSIWREADVHRGRERGYLRKILRDQKSLRMTAFEIFASSQTPISTISGRRPASRGTIYAAVRPDLMLTPKHSS